MPTKIEWTDESWNPVRGCSRVSEGCRNCYAEGVAARFTGAGMPYEGLITKTTKGPTWNGEIKLVPEKLDQPLRWTRPRRIFVNSMSDLFHPAVPDEFVDKVFAVMALAKQHTFQILTKRPDRMLRYFTHHFTRSKCARKASVFSGKFGGVGGGDISVSDGPFPLPNVWLGVSVEDQATADERIPLLLQTPAAVRWISAEPLLGPVDLERVMWPQPRTDHPEHRVDVLRGGYWNRAPYMYGAPSAAIGEEKGGFTNHSDMPGTIDWVVVGGESGPNARPMHPDWARALRDQCAAAGVPFMFKQWGEWRPICQGACDWYQSLYKSKRVARVDEDQQALDDMFGRICTVSELCLRNDGQHAAIAEAGAWQAGTQPVHAFKVGKKAAGRLLDGTQHDGYPVTRHSIKEQK